MPQETLIINELLRDLACCCHIQQKTANLEIVPVATTKKIKGSRSRPYLQYSCFSSTSVLTAVISCIIRVLKFRQNKGNKEQLPCYFSALRSLTKWPKLQKLNMLPNFAAVSNSPYLEHDRPKKGA